MIVEIVNQVDVDAVWPRIAARVTNCIDRFGGDASAGDLWLMCRAGHVFLIVARDGDEIKGASIWRFEKWVGETVFKNLIIVGEAMYEWLPMMKDQARDMAMCGGATAYVCEGRKGWERLFPDATVYKIMYRMEI